MNRCPNSLWRRRLKRKVLIRVGLIVQLLYNRLLRNLVHGIPIHINGLERSCWAGVFTAAAAHADFLVHFRDDQFAVAGIQVGHHVNGLGRAVLGAGSAVGVVRVDHTVFLDEVGHADLGLLFLFLAQRQDGTAGTNVGADCAVKVTVCRVEGHLRLHHTGQAVVEE